MSENIGIKETTEAGVAGLYVSALLVKHLKDGFDAGKDLPAIFIDFSNNKELLEKVKAGYEGAVNIPEEIKDISVVEGFQLVTGLYPAILHLITQFSSKAE